MHQTTSPTSPIRTVKALRELADFLEAQGPDTPMQRVLNRILSDPELIDPDTDDSQRVLDLLLTNAYIGEY